MATTSKMTVNGVEYNIIDKVAQDAVAAETAARETADTNIKSNAMMSRDREGATDSRTLKKIGTYNINTSWYTDLTTDFGSGKIGSLICFGRPGENQMYHALYLETGALYYRWVHPNTPAAGSWVLINEPNGYATFLNLKGQNGVTDSKLLQVGFYNVNTSWYTDLSDTLGSGKIGILFVYGNPTNQHYQIFIQETGSIWFRWINAAGTYGSTWKQWYKPFARTGSYKAFGDSRCYGYLSGSGSQSQYRYPKFIGDELEMGYGNYAISGSGLFARPDRGIAAAIDTVSGVDLSGTDLITIEYGVNDYQHPIGTYTDTGDTTWCGRLYQLLKYISETEPNASVIVIGSANTAEGTQETDYGYGYTLSSGWSLGGLIDEEAKLCAKYHVPFISGYDGPFNNFNIETLMPDDIHFLDQGYLMRSRYLLGKVKSFFGVNNYIAR